MGVLMGIFIYICIGCLVDLLVTKFSEPPHLIMVIVWPIFLVIAVKLTIGDERLKKEINDDTN